MSCEIQLCDGWNSGNGGMDRGRLMAAMDAELAAALRCDSAERGEDELRWRGGWSAGRWRWRRMSSGGTRCLGLIA